MSRDIEMNEIIQENHLSDSDQTSHPSHSPSLGLLHIFQSSENSEIPNINHLSVFCQICNQALSESKFTMPNCLDTFCTPCITIYLKFKIEEGQVLSIPCPAIDCGSRFSDKELESLTPKDLYTKYLRFKRIEDLLQDPNTKLCPLPDCEGYDTGNLDKTKLKCNKCGLEYCFYCNEKWHGSKKCKLFIEKSFDVWLKNNGARFCPNCKRKVEKSMGCDHMTCIKCNFEWCWLCGMKYGSNHYSKCEVRKYKKIDPAVWIVVVLIMSPALFPFSCVSLLFYYTFRIRTSDGDNEFGRYRKINKIIKKCWIFSYFLSVILGLILTPFFFVVLPFIVGLFFFHKVFSIWFKRSILLSIFCYPLVCVAVVLFIALSHIAGILLIFWKLIIRFVRCFNPSYMKPKNYYNYII